MKKICILGILAPFIFIQIAWGFCADLSAIKIREDLNIKNYDELDKQLAGVIEEITKELARGRGIENASIETLTHIQALKQKYLLLEKEILFNQEQINELNSILIDMIGENANVQSGKKSIESIKRELFK